MPTETGGDTNPSQNPSGAVDGGAAPRKTPPRPDPHITDRNALLDAIDAQIVEQREAENAEFLAGADPRAAAFYAEMQAEAAGRAIEADGPRRAVRQTQEAPADEDGAPAPRATPKKATPAAEADPLADYIVRGERGPMFRAMVDGQEITMPLEEARAVIQKNRAADKRLQEAAQRRKELDAREAQLTKRERTALSAAPANPAADDADLEQEAAGLVRSLLSEPEAVAAQKMTGVLKKIRQAKAPAIDPNAIVTQAANVAVQTIAARDDVIAKASAFKKFQADYSDIANDPDLFALADRKSDSIYEEHPNWTPEQIMLEAGRQTREWLEGKAGKQTASPTPARPANYQQGQQRQQAKQKLVPVPVSRTVRPVLESTTDDDDSPAAVLREARKARGQAY
jgi:hypothetical protein